MIGTGSDKSWERFGRQDPYFGVLSHARFRLAHEPGPQRAEFFASGEQHIEELFSTIQRELDPNFSPKRALDFGCGVGRILIPLARRAHEAVGIDVSRSMLDEAHRNCTDAGISNVDLLLSDDKLSALNAQQFDFIHSFIVLQHIPERRGIKIFRSLLSRLAPGGVGALHVVYAARLPLFRRVNHWVHKNIPLAHPFANLIRRRPLRAPLMQMNIYRLEVLLQILQDSGCTRANIQFTDHGGYLGAIMYFKKAAI